MLTGKIYKNKLSALEEDNTSNRHTQDTRHLQRIKSQPGLNYTNNYLRSENAESIPIGTLKSQR